MQALQDVGLQARPGEGIGLVGENGAHKYHADEDICGVVQPGAGRTEMGGRAHAERSVTQSTTAEIAFVHQELNLFDNLDVAANLCIGREPLRSGPLRLVDRKRMAAQRMQAALDIRVPGGDEPAKINLANTASLIGLFGIGHLDRRSGRYPV